MRELDQMDKMKAKPAKSCKTKINLLFCSPALGRESGNGCMSWNFIVQWHTRGIGFQVTPRTTYPSRSYNLPALVHRNTSETGRSSNNDDTIVITAMSLRNFTRRYWGYTPISTGILLFRPGERRSGSWGGRGTAVEVVHSNLNNLEYKPKQIFLQNRELMG